MSKIRRVSLEVVANEEMKCRLLNEVERLSGGTKQEREMREMRDTVR